MSSSNFFKIFRANFYPINPPATAPVRVPIAVPNPGQIAVPIANPTAAPPLEPNKPPPKPVPCLFILFLASAYVIFPCLTFLLSEIVYAAKTIPQNTQATGEKQAPDATLKLELVAAITDLPVIDATCVATTLLL